MQYPKVAWSQQQRKHKLNISNPQKPIPKRRHFFLNILVETISTFCRESTLHGFRNLVTSIQDPSETRNQRMFRAISLVVWISSMILGLIFALVLMYLVWYKFQTTPTMTTVESNNFPIGNLNFPGVTICNNNKVWAPATKNITRRLMEQGLSQDRIQAFYSELTKLLFPIAVEDEFDDALNALQAINYTIEHLMFDVMQPCSVMLEQCDWLGQTKPCHSLFRVATSEEGFCCSFNYKAPLDSEEVDTENDYIEDATNDKVYRVYGAGQFVGLNVLIHVDTSEYLAYSHSYYGVAILVHGSQKFPQMSDTTVIAQPGSDVTVAVIPTVVVSEPSVRNLPLKQRNCYFDDESQLRTTNRYSYELCIAECAVKTIYATCSCLPFYYAEVHLRAYSGLYRQCTLRDVNCLKKNKHIFSSLQPSGDLNETVGMECENCLPSCSSERFTVQTIVAKRSDTNPLPPSQNLPHVNLSNYVTLRVHFKDVSCIKYRRDVVLSWDALLASFGGIFGLCLGGSVISIIELLYFFTIRLCSRAYGNSVMDEGKSRSEFVGHTRKPVLMGETTQRKAYPKMVQIVGGNTMESTTGDFQYPFIH